VEKNQTTMIAAEVQKTGLEAGPDAAGAPPRRSRRRTRASPIEKLWGAYARAPGDETRNRLVEHYQPLVTEIVRRLSARLPRLIDRGDLDTAANFGLMAAIEGFDAARGVRFEVYCERRVRGALLDELRNQDWLSRPFRGRLEQLRRVSEGLRSHLGREPSEAEVAQALGPGDARRGFELGLSAGFATPVLSGRAEEWGEDALAGLELLADPDSDAPRERLGSDDLYRLVAQRLTVQEYQIVYLRYWEDLSLREIGEVLHLSESRVCKVHVRLLERLKERLATAG
jgi:RNA polymerase sigma factor for flagellar operon FliA